MVTLFLYGKSKDFFLEGDIRNIPDCPGRNNSHFALENEDSKCPLSFQYGILPGSCPLYLCPANSFQDKFGSNKLEILTGTSSDFSDISSDISAPWAHESNSPFVDRKSKTLECWLATQTHLLQHRHMLCNKRIESSVRVLQVLFTSACKAPRVQLSSCFHLIASLYLCPADGFQDILFEKTGNSLWKQVAFLQRTKWHNCSAGAWKYLTWCQ